MTESWRGRQVKLINPKAWFLFLFFLILPVFSAGFAEAHTDLLWWESKAGNRPAAVSRKKPVRLALCRGKFQHVGHDENAIDGAVKPNSVNAWIRSPDGAVSMAGLFEKDETAAFDFPSGLNPAGLNGLYLIGAHMDAKPVDIASDGGNETVHYYAKYLICCNDKESIDGKRPDVFFKDAEKIPLEIGPLDAMDTVEKGSCVKAGCQQARKKHRMKVLYKGLPLAGAKVIMLTESGWKKIVKTDADGIFSILPVEDKEKAERCLYAVTYKNPSTGEYHCSSLTMLVTAPPPLWMSRAKSFDFWAVIGSGIFILYVIWKIYRKIKQDKKTMFAFENRRIRRN
ncbi:MAG: hypothetical protein J7K30_11025 [Deltaproteobacteria bacterium]|nr:hypothetical protein [Deltaproteobacteria bacterium]